MTEIMEPLLEQMRQTFRNMLEVAGILKTGHLTLTTREGDTEWVDLKIEIRPKTMNWIEAMKQVEGQITLSNLVSVDMAPGPQKLDFFHKVAEWIQQLAAQDGFADETREDLTKICEDTLEALAKAPDQPGQLQPAKFIKCNTCNELVPAKFIEYLADDDDTAICLVCLQRARAVQRPQKLDPQPTPIVKLNEKITEMELDIEERDRQGKPNGYPEGYLFGLKDSRRIFMKYWEVTSNSAIYEHAAQCSICGRVAPAHLLKPAADTGKSICMACIDEKRQALKSCHPIGKPPGCEKGFCFDCEDEMADHLLGRDLRHRVQQAMGRISSDNWDDMINTINNMRARSGARGKQLFELKRAIMQIKQKLKKEVARYQDDEGRALDAEERDEHDQHGAFIRGIRAALVFLDGFENSRARFRICVICGKKLLITPPKGPEELPVPGRVVCESCTKKATDQTEQRDFRPLLASICNCIEEIVYRMGSGNTQGTLQVYLKKLKERAERAGLVLASKS